jgi:hypothetical protein
MAKIRKEQIFSGSALDGKVLTADGSGSCDWEAVSGAGSDTSAIHDNAAGEIDAVTEKVAPVSGDFLLIEDSADSYNKKKVQVGNLPSSSGTDTSAIHDNASGEINAIGEKTVPADADLILIEDSADSYNKKKLRMDNLPSSSGTDSAAIHDNVAGEINAISEKITPADADLVIIEDSADAHNKKKIQIANLLAETTGDVATDAIWDAKGDLAVGTGADTSSRLAVGTDGKILVANSGEATGLKWDGPVATSAYHDADQTCGTGAWVTMALNSEISDTGSMHSTSVNNSRLSAPAAGYYSAWGCAEFAANANGQRYARILLNGTTVVSHMGPLTGTATANTRLNISWQGPLAANDYLELQVYQNTGGDLALKAVASLSPYFAMHLVR